MTEYGLDDGIREQGDCLPASFRLIPSAELCCENGGDLSSQDRAAIRGGEPHDFPVDPEIRVYQDIAEGYDPGPGHLGMASTEVVRNTRGRFADNAQFLNDGTAKKLGLLKSLEAGIVEAADHIADFISGTPAEAGQFGRIHLYVADLERLSHRRPFRYVPNRGFHAPERISALQITLRRAIEIFECSHVDGSPIREGGGPGGGIWIMCYSGWPAPVWGGAAHEIRCALEGLRCEFVPQSAAGCAG